MAGDAAAALRYGSDEIQAWRTLAAATKQIDALRKKKTIQTYNEAVYFHGAAPPPKCT